MTDREMTPEEIAALIVSRKRPRKWLANDLALMIERAEKRGASLDEGLRAKIEVALSQPTFDIRTGSARGFFDKAKRSATQEVTISAQQLRVLLPSIETEAITQFVRALAQEGETP